MADDSARSWATFVDTLDDHAVSVREVVAFNLARGRRRRDLTQEQLGQRLGRLTGTRWSPATVSAAEKGWKGKSGRVRKFDVDDLVAFACALEMPLAWFFAVPTDQDEETGQSKPVTDVTINKSGNAPYALIPIDRLSEIAGNGRPVSSGWLLNDKRTGPVASSNPSEDLFAELVREVLRAYVARNEASHE